MNVNAVAPGYVRTDNTQALRDDPERYAADPRAHPRRTLGRAGGHRGRDRVPLLVRRRLRSWRSAAGRRRLARPMSGSVVTDALAEARVLPVVAVDDPTVVGDLCASLQAGGISCIEITFRTRAAERAIAAAADVEGMLVGAGTVLIAGPGAGGCRCRRGVCRRPGDATKPWSRRVRELALPFFPGVATPTELGHALNLGCTVVKVFPAPNSEGRRSCVPSPRRSRRHASSPPAGSTQRRSRRISACRRCSRAVAAGSPSRALIASAASTRVTRRARAAVAIAA